MIEPLITVKNFHALTGENDSLRVSCTIGEEGKSGSELWFEISGLPRNSTIDVADAFLAPSLLFALKRNSGLRFEVPISDSLARQANDVAHIFGIQLGYNTKIEIEIPWTVTVERKQRGGATGFSAGVDSWFSVKENFLDCRIPSKKLSHLLVSDVGANAGAQKKSEVLRRAEDTAEEFGLGLICVASNMTTFLEMNFQKTHTARNASVAHLLSPICDTFYYSSTDTYADAGVFQTYDMAYADTILLPLLSSDSVVLRSTGSALSRAEKTRAILDIPRIGERLDVCVNHSHAKSKINCGFCWKCLRTELTLDALGALPQFEPVFDLDIYRKNRWRYIRTVSLSNKPTEKEAFELALESGLAGSRWLVNAQGAGIEIFKRLGLGRMRSALRSR